LGDWEKSRIGYIVAESCDNVKAFARRLAIASDVSSSLSYFFLNVTNAALLSSSRTLFMHKITIKKEDVLPLHRQSQPSLGCKAFNDGHSPKPKAVSTHRKNSSATNHTGIELTHL
jgi:hypothetical protein